MNLAMQKEKILYSVRDLAAMIDTSESAIRMHLFRKTGFIPEPIKTGGKRLFWTFDQLVAHFQAMVPPPSPPPAPKKTGRPTKRSQIAKANQVTGSV